MNKSKEFYGTAFHIKKWLESRVCWLFYEIWRFYNQQLLWLPLRFIIMVLGNTNSQELLSDLKGMSKSTFSH